MPIKKDSFNKIKKVEGSNNSEAISTASNTIEPIDFSGFQASESTSESRDISQPGVISIINSKNGKRVAISSELLAFLNNPTDVQVAFSSNAIAMAEKLPNAKNSYTIKEGKNKGLLYAGRLVDEITARFGLDFSDKTSITFHEATYSEIDGYHVAIISVTHADSDSVDE